MAKQLAFTIGNGTYQASITKVDRDKVYGFVEEVVLDRNGSPCTTANLLDDGSTLILSGGTALKTVTNDNTEVDKADLKAVYMDGTDAVIVPSSYDGPITLQSASLDDLFNLEVTAIYQLTWEDEAAKQAMLKDLDGPAVYRLVFNYRADYEGADAVVIRALDEVFMLTGRMLDFEYATNANTMQVEDVEEVESDETELDFGML